MLSNVSRNLSRSVNRTVAGKATVLLCLAASLNGCAFVYDSLQGAEQDKCERGPSRDRDSVKACQDRHRESYDAYEQRRKKEQLRLGPEKKATAP